MSDIVAFIRARLDEDQRDFEDVIEIYHPSESASALKNSDENYEWCRRMLRGVNAKRRMLALHAQGHECPSEVTDPYPNMAGYYDGDCPTILAMASEWSGHEAYREEWK